MMYEVTGKLVIDYRAREWCKLPYPDHPSGCPNYGKKPECPPQAPLIEDFIDLTKPHWFIIVEFNLKAHAEKMKLRPRKNRKLWTEKQARCCLYWQSSVVKQLKKICIEFCSKNGLYFSDQSLCPEGTGVHVIRTAKKVGIPIKSRPKGSVFKIALIGYPKESPKTILDYLTM